MRHAMVSAADEISPDLTSSRIMVCSEISLLAMIILLLVLLGMLAPFRARRNVRGEISSQRETAEKLPW